MLSLLSRKVALSLVLFTGFYLRLRPSHFGKFISAESLSNHKAEGSTWPGAELAVKGTGPASFCAWQRGLELCDPGRVSSATLASAPLSAK